MMFAAPLFLLAAIVLPAPLSRLAGVAVLAVLVGLTWRAAMVGSVDLVLLMGGAMLARRFGFPKPVSMIWARRLAKAFVGFVFAEFAICALLVANYTGDATYALPFDLGMLLAGLALVKLVSNHRQASAPNRREFLIPPSQPSLTYA